MTPATPTLPLRPAVRADLPALQRLIDGSVRALSRPFYTDAQIDSGLRFVFGPDTALIDDGTYFVIVDSGGDVNGSSDASGPRDPSEARSPSDARSASARPVIAAAGGWSRRRTLYGGDQTKSGPDPLLDPRTEAARIRAFFVDPRYARRGLGRQLLAHCASLARAEGFGALELMATLPGVPLYRALGFVEVEPTAPVLPDGVALPMVRMHREFR